MQGLPYSYRFYDSIFSMVNTRYRVQKNEGIVGGFHGVDEKCGDKLKGAKPSIKRSMST